MSKYHTAIDTIAECAVEDWKAGGMETYENYFERKRNEVVKTLGNVNEYFSLGFNKLLETPEGAIYFKKQGADFFKTLTPDKLIEETERGIKLKTIYRLDDNLLSSFYDSACEAYKNGEFQDACYMFNVLALMDLDCFQFWVGLGLSQAALGNDEIAVQMYDIAIELNPAQPFTHMVAADSLHKIEKIDAALESVERVIKLCKSEEVSTWQTDLLERAELKKKLLRT